MNFETILLDIDAADHVATITLNRPDRLNAFNRTMCEEIAQAWRIVKLDDSVHAVVLRANGNRAFSAGRPQTRAPTAVAASSWWIERSTSSSDSGVCSAMGCPTSRRKTRSSPV